jgi:hypothetical protein
VRGHGRCRRRIDNLDGPSDDVDSDGVKNVDDNCPIVSPPTASEPSSREPRDRAHFGGFPDPPTEAQALRSKGEAYRAYQQRVSRFIPMPPKA